ncbi:MAG: hypothetical protein AAFV87_19385 [Pseudomonadota bacterium]
MHTRTFDHFAVNTPTILSALWVVVLANMLLDDLRQAIRAGFLELPRIARVYGPNLPEDAMLYCALMVHTVTLMVAVPHVLPYRFARPITFSVGVLLMVGQLINADGPFFVALQFGLHAGIIGLAVLWHQ